MTQLHSQSINGMIKRSQKVILQKKKNVITLWLILIMLLIECVATHVARILQNSSALAVRHDCI